MKKTMLIGRTGCGKTTLTQKLMNEEVKYKKTQAVSYKNKIIIGIMVSYELIILFT